MQSIFKQAKSIVADIEHYLDNIDRSASIFEMAIKDYFSENKNQFKERCKEIGNLESENDELRGKIKITLYTDLLIPDARGDVLGLIETLDNVIDVAEYVSIQFSIEQPKVYSFLKDDFISLTEASVRSVSELITASRAFFRQPGIVRDHIKKVHFWEHEADKIEQRIKRKVFGSNEVEDLGQKIHMRYFAEQISQFADEAEDVAERLEVYAIKRAF
jgi:predicted phosphate transport protein (TIGR00153 family)